MELLEAFYRRKLKKQKKNAIFHSQVELNRTPSLVSVGATATGGDTTATGLMTRVLHLIRRRESRPHSWHSIKLGDGSSESVENVSGSSIHISAADLLSGLGSGGGVSWSLESLQPHTSGPPGAAHLVPRSSSSCLQLSSTRSSSSDLLHCKRNTAYSSCSPSLSFPEDLGVGSERSFSLESVQQTADLKRIQHKPYVLDSESRARVRLREQSAGRAYYHGTSENRLLNRHSLGPIWSSGQSSYENLKGALAPQRLSDSYTATSSEQLSSWSSLEHARSLRSVRSQQKGGSTTLSAKGLYTTEGQLHTVIEKSPESSPSSKPRQVQSPGPPRPTNHASGSNLGLNPTPHREHWDGYAHTYHRALEAERSLKEPRDHLNIHLGSLSCHSAHASQYSLTRPEHPLTQLEKALVEVQGAESTCMSVLEKVSRLEHREWATRQQGISNSRHRTGHKQAGDRGTSHGADMRNLPESSCCRPLSHEGDLQEKNMSTHICTNFNQSQKGSRQDLRESQTQVVWSTSFKYKKLQSAPSVSPLPVPPKEHSCLDKRDSKHLPPPEKTGPKTLPKPHAGVFTPRPSAQMASLPTPTPFPAPMPAPLPGGLPLTRICGRKRLTWDQRKKSFSEPKCMNEIGLTHAESTALLRRAGDTSVAIHRRMFEQVSQGLVGRVSVVVGEALEQDARLRLDSKCNQRKGCSQRRPQSAVLQPLHSPADLSPLSLVTSSSRLSLQGCAQEPQLFSGKEDLSSPLASGGDCNTPCYTVIYPGRVTAPRAPALQLPKVAEGPSAADVVSPPLLAHSRTREPHLVPVPRKKRARRSDHSTLAASVGLPCPLSDAARHLSILPPPGHDLPPSNGQDTAAPTNSNHIEIGTANRSTSSDKLRAIGGSEPKHPPQGKNQPMAREDGASTVHGADCENDALSLKTQPCPPVCPASCPSVPVASRHSVPPVSCPPVPMPPPIQMSSPDEAMQNSLGLNYEPVPLRLQSPEEQRVRELLQRLVQCDGSLAPLMDVWGKSTVDVLLDICPNSPLFAELSQEQRESSLQDHWSQGPSGVNSEHDLISQKVELCEALRSCIESLEQEKEELSDAIRAHMELGRQVEAWVQEHCEAAHRTKYVMFIGDLERVVNLLLSLCGRLARVERSLASLRRQEPAEDSTELWDSLLHKQSILLRQTQDALELRDHLERRQCIVHEFLCYSLEPSQLQQYQRLVSSTPALVITHRRLDEMLQQTQEQLSLLLDTLPLEVTQARGWSRVGLALSATPLLKISQVPPK